MTSVNLTKIAACYGRPQTRPGKEKRKNLKGRKMYKKIVFAYCNTCNSGSEGGKQMTGCLWNEQIFKSFVTWYFVGTCLNMKYYIENR